jgi:uncharacterized protein DUF1996
MRWRALAIVFVVLFLAGSQAAPFKSAPAVHLAAAGGPFKIRCFFNGNAIAMDPLDSPGTYPTDHLHVFFGNMISGTPAFPSIASGDNTSTGVTMEDNGLSTQTNCQDDKDTSGYWIPEPYFNHVPWLGPDSTGCSTNCSINEDMYQREYYLPSSLPSSTKAHPFQEIPDGSIMIVGYPDGCQPYTPAGGKTIRPAGCPANGSRSYPMDTKVVRYTCGESGGSTISTPASAWPYNCANYRDSDDTWNQGIQADVSFPDCWNGKSDWPAPNDPSNKVPGFVSPWIPDPNAPTSNNVRLNDFAYAVNGVCPHPYITPVVQLGERTHLLMMGNAGKGFGEPSSCIGDNGYSWNDPAHNAEWNDGDGDTPHTCVAASRPSPSITLSFSCTQGGDPNCNDDTGKTGCASSNGDCYIGASPFGWETLHADYWQTWQEGGGTPTGDGTDNFPDPTQGSFRDLIEDCSTSGTGSCGFVTNTQPVGRVYGDPETS